VLYLALGLGGGLFGGLLWGLTLDSFDDRVRTPEEVAALTRLPELCSVPFLASLSRKKPKETGPLKPLNLLTEESQPLSARDPYCAAGEAYRVLSSVILLSSFHNPPKVLVVTSALSGEGKSTVSSNLATALAQRGRRTLLVDADLRCSSIHRHWGLSKDPGLSTMLMTSSMDYYRCQPIAELPGLHVVPSGLRPDRPAEMLSSNTMQELIENWRKDYDTIIVDTPPLLPFADALTLTSRADGVILVTRSGVSRQKALSRAIEVLTRSRANVLGFVFNAVRHPEYYHEYPKPYKELVNIYKTAASNN
jgi:capsular exopolysaccharide synthesis family protein